MTSNLGATEANVMGFAKKINKNENKAINKIFAQSLEIDWIQL